jgi:phosphatidate phosphatase APP1
MLDPQNEFIDFLHRAAQGAENAFDRSCRSIAGRLGRNRPRSLAAYAGYCDAHGARLSGRVLANRPWGGPLEDDRWWQNLLNTWRRWESDEIPFADVTIRHQEQEVTVKGDEEGYYSANFQIQRGEHAGLVWSAAEARVAADDREPITASHDIMIPPERAAFGVISDLDDTVIHTGITSILLAAKLTFLENARTRKPLEGVAGLYQALQRGTFGIATNPIFYISSSPWNLHDLLVDFLRLNDIPAGPLLLRDFGIDRDKFFKESGHDQKLVKALELLDSYPDLPFILIGDSGQEDPSIYARVAQQRPGRVTAIYIRDVDPTSATTGDTTVQQSVAEAGNAGVPMLLVNDSMGIVKHANELGLIAATATDKVVEETAADQSRESLTSKSLDQAIESILPGTTPSTAGS